MLTNIKVDGYRSLHEFEIALEPGLNVFIGPNGSGKTNIFAFFEFVSNLSKIGLRRAIGHSGGAPGVFSHENLQSGSPILNFTLYGLSKAYGNEAESGIKSFRYRYEGSIYFDKTISEARFRRQSFSVKAMSRQPRTLSLIAPDNVDWDFNAEIIENNEGPKPFITKVEVKNGDLFDEYVRKYPREESIDSVKRSLSYAAYEQACILRSLSLSFSVMRSIEADLAAGSPYNIDPTKAKAPDDIASGFGLGSDGSGLAATLHSLKLAQEGLRPQIRYIGGQRHRVSRSAFKIISKYMKLINTSIESMNVKSDYLLNKHIVYFQMKVDDKNIDIPLSSMSDGTAKWLSLVTALHSEFGIFSIEEPENFLHPKMQRELFDLIRENSSISSGRGIAMVSTHSMTLLDYCQPEEVIVTDYRDGRTVASRPKNSEIIREEIKNTGFGLSYYALAGSLGDY
ncbi:AAA family ATPase [Alkalicaulis satelles]|uniref:AAA family ATPase n=1 Tax=Alkalicaulis satelles TaxID=2609175 RepID=A0A5M6ZGL1_9PROT|nr:AAA family ATPase [Alkalicaulis satelles]KAA5803893.1 AAA family ATPase [Alkalicaulis satelles]